MFTAEEQSLITGNVREFANCDHCMVIDWRSSVDEVLEDALRWLPADSLHHECLDLDETQLKLTFAGREDRVTVQQEIGDNWLGVHRLSRLLRPDYELLLFGGNSVGDTAKFLIRSSEWWTAYRAQCPGRYRKYFAPTEQYSYLWDLPESKMPRPQQRPWWKCFFSMNGKAELEANRPGRVFQDYACTGGVRLGSCTRAKQATLS